MGDGLSIAVWDVWLATICISYRPLSNPCCLKLRGMPRLAGWSASRSSPTPAKNRVLNLAARSDTLEAAINRLLFGISKELDGRPARGLAPSTGAALSLRALVKATGARPSARQSRRSRTKITSVLSRVERRSSWNPRGPRMGRGAKQETSVRKNEIPMGRQTRTAWPATSYNKWCANLPHKTRKSPSLALFCPSSDFTKWQKSPPHAAHFTPIL
jgi:hypothetical protein